MCVCVYVCVCVCVCVTVMSSFPKHDKRQSKNQVFNVNA